MANRNHLAILRQGVAPWNQWRQDHPEIAEPDLAEADLWGEDLVDANLAGANLAQADLVDANLKRAQLKRADLPGVHLEGAHLEGAHLVEAHLEGAYLMRAHLEGAHLEGAHLEGALLTEAHLEKAYLVETHLEGAHLEGAYLAEALLIRANLRGANLAGANFACAILDNTIFSDVDLSQPHGLPEVTHYGPSSIDISTLLRSQGNIPTPFLLGAGVPADTIDYLNSIARAFAGKVITFYDCFISYSSQNQHFADRIHTDLQARNVPNWFASEDMKIGSKIRDTIDQQIRRRDKLLLVLSAQALASNWVETEVEIALEEERRRQTTVLFPIRLDDAVMTSPAAWAAELRRRHIGDFCRWEDHDSYQQALDRLIRDLRTDAPPPLPIPKH